MIIVSFLLFFMVSNLVLSKINEIKRCERFNLFIAAYGMKENNYQNELYELLKDDGIKQVNFYSYLLDDKDIAKYYDAFGYNADAVIFSDSDVESMSGTISTNFMGIGDKLSTALSLDGYKGYYFDDVRYAIMIHDKNDEEYNSKFNYSSWIEFGSGHSFFLLLNIRSTNYGMFSEKNESEVALKGIKYILDESRIT